MDRMSYPIEKDTIDIKRSKQTQQQLNERNEENRKSHRSHRSTKDWTGDGAE